MINLFDRHGVPWRLWGTDTNRTFDDFLAYHQRDRLDFRKGRSNSLVIDVRVAVVVVIYKHGGQWLELYEDRQEFPNGKILRRNYNGISETIKRAETHRQAAMRCLREELRFRAPSEYRLSGSFSVEHRDPVPSEKFPGIRAAYHRYIFECEIPDKLFKPEGYVENEDGRLIYFKWKQRAVKN